MTNSRSNLRNLTRRSVLVLLAVMLYAAASHAQTPAQPSLGSAGTFGVLGGSTVTNTGPTEVSGDVGVSPGTAITGFPPGVVTNGALHAGDMVAARAHADTFIAYQDLKGRTCTPMNNLTGQDLGGMTLPPGVYCFSSSAQLTGTLVLTGAGPWIFQIGSTLTTATAAAVIVPPGGTCRAANVFWQVGSSATLGYCHDVRRQHSGAGQYHCDDQRHRRRETAGHRRRGDVGYERRLCLWRRRRSASPGR